MERANINKTTTWLKGYVMQAFWGCEDLREFLLSCTPSANSAWSFAFALTNEICKRGPSPLPAKELW